MSEHCVRRLRPSDLDALLALQRRVLADTISAQLGPRFNRTFHQTMLASDHYFCDGYFDGVTLVGYLSYTADTQRLLRGVFRQNLVAYLRALALDVLRAPHALGLIYRVARSVVLSPTDQTTTVPAELLSVGVLPAFRGSRSGSGKAQSVADSLLKSALANLRARGVAAVQLVSKPADVDPVPHRFLRKYGFTPAGPVRRFGLNGEMYVLRLSAERDGTAHHA